ncbi:MAG: hypothetical protein U0W40_11475 [Acidimicrobiia bacterium]
MKRLDPNGWRILRAVAGVTALFLGFGCLMMACTVGVIHGFEAQAGPVDTSDVGEWLTAGAALVALGVVVLIAVGVNTWWSHRHRPS